MSVISYVENDLFIFRVVKYLASNPDRKWANTYEFRATDVGGEAQLLGLGTALVNFEAACHMTAVTFDRLLISTWQPDSVPYDPAAFISTTLTAVGTRGGLADLVALQTAFSVTRQASSGRFGHIFYRGVLLEDDISAPAGSAILVDRSNMQDLIDNGLASSGLDDYIGSAPTGTFGMVMVSADGTNVRAVNALRAQGVSQLPTDHAWFNRTSPTP